MPQDLANCLVAAGHLRHAAPEVLSLGSIRSALLHTLIKVFVLLSQAHSVQCVCVCVCVRVNFTHSLPCTEQRQALPAIEEHDSATLVVLLSEIAAAKTQRIKDPT